MRFPGPLRRWAVLLATAACAGLLASCGGGGGGGGDGANSVRRVTATWAAAPLSYQGIEGYPHEIETAVTLEVNTPDALYVVLEERNGVVVDGRIQPAGNTLGITVVIDPALAPGVHDTELILHVCEDEACTRELAGSPSRRSLRFEVKPQIKIQAPAEMRRVGREAAPSQSLAMTFTPEMGTPQLSTTGALQAFNITLQGDRINVTTRQLPAGTYVAQVELRGSADPLYRAAVELRYVVEPPPGGELPLSVSPPFFNLTMPQGATATHRFRVQRPTWTDVLDPPVLSRTTVVKSVRDLGNDEFEFTVDTRDVPPTTPFFGSDVTGISVRAGPDGGDVGVTVVVTIDPPVQLGNPALSWFLTASSTLADLRQSTSVLDPEGATRRWTVTSNQPWMKVLRNTGLTGADDLLLEVDPSIAALPGRVFDATLTFTVDKPGTQPFAVTVPVSNRIPRFDMASPGTVLGTTARVRIHGNVENAGEIQPPTGLLQVQGATLQAVSLETDTRFVGFVGVLAVDLSNVVAGQPIIIRTTSVIAPTQVVVQAAAVPRVPAGYAALPFDSYRPASFALGRSQLVFAGSRAVWRWPLSASWGAPQSAALFGLNDATIAPDESVIFATAGPRTALALDPTSLAVLRQADFPNADPVFQLPSDRFDTAVPAGAAALRFASDGRAVASVMPGAGFEGTYGSGVAQVAGCVPAAFDSFRADIALGPCLVETGLPYPNSPGTVGVALARSTHGDAIAATYSTGVSKVFRGITTQYVAGPSLPAGRVIKAVSDAADWMIRDDGLLLSTTSSLTMNLRQAVPAGHTAGGFALTGAGRFALVYGYRVAAEAGGLRARDAALYIVDLRAGIAALQAPPSVAAVVPLTDAVGCTATLVAGELCEHGANVTVAPGDASAFVLGPRGVAAVALAEPVAAARSPERARGSFLRRLSP